MYVLNLLAEFSKFKVDEMLAFMDGFLCCQDPVGYSFNDSVMFDDNFIYVLKILHVGYGKCIIYPSQSLV